MNTCKLKADVTLPAERPISLDTFNRLTTVLAQFDTALRERANALAAQTAATKSAKAALRLARRTNAHFILALNQAIARGSIKASARAFYQLHLNSEKLPRLRSEADVTVCALQLVEGEAARVAQGGAAIAFPTIAEVESACADFESKRLAQGTLSIAMSDKERAVASLRPAVDRLVRDLWNEIEFSFRHGTAARCRKRARHWGVFYDRRPGEPAEELVAAED